MILLLLWLLLQLLLWALLLLLLWRSDRRCCLISGVQRARIRRFRWFVRV